MIGIGETSYMQVRNIGALTRDVPGYLASKILSSSQIVRLILVENSILYAKGPYNTVISYDLRR